MQYKLIKLSAKEYQDLSLKSKELCLLQTVEWAELKNDWEVERFGLLREGVEEKEIIAVGQLLLRPFLLGLKLAYLAYGPLLLPGAEKSERFIFYRELKAELQQDKSVFLLKVHVPDLRKLFPLGAEEPEDEPAKDQAYLKAMSELGFVHQGFSRDLDSSIQPRYQAVIYAEDWPEKPFSRLRYNLRQLERREVRIETGGAERLDEFMHCLACTEARQEISLRNPQYFKRLLEIYGDQAKLYLAVFDIPKGAKKAASELEQKEAELAGVKENQVKKRRQLEEQLSSAKKIADFFDRLESREEKTIGAALALHLGPYSEMPYAGNDEEFFELPGAWGIYNEVIQEAFAKGAKRLSLGGVEGSFDDGLSRFKAHFNPRIEESYGEFDLSLKPLVTKAFKLALKLRKKLRG